MHGTELEQVLNMNISVSINNTTVLIMARAEGDGIIGDLMHELKQGDSFFNIPYSTFIDKGEGMFDLKDGTLTLI